MYGLLDSIIFTLNKVETHGKDNLDRLLGCIQTLEQLRDSCKTKTIVEEVAENDNQDEQGENV